MKANLLKLRAGNGTLTCSEVLEMLMSQPTHDETSHAHLHTLDSFQHDEKKWAANYESMTWFYQERITQSEHVESKRRQWAPDSHLNPKLSHGARSYSDDAHLLERARLGTHGVLMDERRLAQSQQYNHRTGLPELPTQPEVRGDVFYVLQFPATGRGAPTKERIATSQALANVLAAQPPYNDPTQYVQNGATGAKLTKGSEVLSAVVPMIPAVPSHSVFPDSESMVLHLTAALLSEAGVNILGTLEKMVPGDGKTVGIFSKTAPKTVRALSKADTVHEMAERTADVNPGTRKDYTGTFTYTTRVIDHVVVVLALAADSSVTVLTCYPSNLTTAQTIKTATAIDEDVEEHTFGTHTKTTQAKPLPTLNW